MQAQFWLDWPSLNLAYSGHAVSGQSQMRCPSLDALQYLYFSKVLWLHIILSEALMHGLKKGEWSHQVRPNCFVNALGAMFFIHSLTETVWILVSRASPAVRWDLGSNSQQEKLYVVIKAQISLSQNMWGMKQNQIEQNKTKNQSHCLWLPQPWQYKDTMEKLSLSQECKVNTTWSN